MEGLLSTGPTPSSFPMYGWLMSSAIQTPDFIGQIKKPYSCYDSVWVDIGMDGIDISTLQKDNEKISTNGIY